MGITAEELTALTKDPLAFDAAKLDGFMSGVPGPDGEADVSSEGKKGETEASTPAATAADEGAAKGATTEPEQKPAAEAPQTKLDETNAVIKTKDGKHEIPYSVLQKEREERTRLEDALRDANARLANAQSEAAKGEKVTTDTGERLTPEQLDEMEREAPTIAKSLRHLYSQIDTLAAKQQEAEAHRAGQVRSAVDEAIDNVPKLAYVRAHDVEKWNAIAEIDIAVRETPQFKALSLGDRFAKVVAMYEAAHGRIELPAGVASSGQGATAPVSEPKLTPEQIAAKAAAALKAAEAKADPDTLSHIPGGQPPAKSELEAVSETSAVALTNKFMGMSQADVDKYLARLG